jgi:hypothetical protein
MDIVQERSPLRVFTPVDAGKSDELALTFCDDDKLTRSRILKSLRPDSTPILKDVTIKILIAIFAPVVRAPTFCMQLSDCGRIELRRRPICNLAHAWCQPD